MREKQSKSMIKISKTLTCVSNAFIDILLNKEWDFFQSVAVVSHRRATVPALLLPLLVQHSFLKPPSFAYLKIC